MLWTVRTRRGRPVLKPNDVDEDGSDSGSSPGREDPHLAEKIAAVRGKRERHKALLEELDRTGEDQISLTDPDSRSMATSGRGSGVVGYNVQVAVDTEHHLIVAHEVTNVVVDRTLRALRSER